MGPVTVAIAVDVDLPSARIDAGVSATRTVVDGAALG